MKIKDIYGRERSISDKKYKVNWDKKVASNLQFSVKTFIKPFWQHHSVYEEWVIPSSKLRLDLFNTYKKIVIEIHGRQHQTYVEHFSRSRAGFLASFRRDLIKEKWVLDNNLILIEIFEEDIKNLSRQWFIDKYNTDII